MSQIMEILATDFQYPQKRRQFLYTTDNLCHRCGCALPDSLPKAHFAIDKSDIFIYLLFNCPKCHQAFMYEYCLSGEIVKSTRIDLTRRTPKIYPDMRPETPFSPDIKDISEKFVEIYHQSEITEATNCTEICGMGYRKAVEFLVKDYLCRLHPGEKDIIAKEKLSVCIKRLEDSRIQTLASRSVWIGNDETHYIRKHTDRDIADMKRFIHAMVYYLQSESALADALSIDAVR